MRCLFPILVLASIASCRASSTIVITESRTTAPAPFERLAVYVILPQRGDRGIYHGLQKAMPKALAACSVQSTVVQGPPDVASPTADAQLIVKSRYGEMRTVTTVDQFGNVLDDKAFEDMELELWLEIYDHKQQRATWLAFAKLHLRDKGSEAGEDFARMIVARLRADGVLEGCR